MMRILAATIKPIINLGHLANIELMCNIGALTIELQLQSSTNKSSQETHNKHEQNLIIKNKILLCSA